MRIGAPATVRLYRVTVFVSLAMVAVIALEAPMAMIALVAAPLAAAPLKAANVGAPAPVLVGALVATARLQLVPVRPPGRRHRVEVTVRLPLRTPLGGLPYREVVLVQGPSGWGEMSPLPGYPCDPARARAAAEEAACGTWPPARRDPIPVNAIVPAVGPDEAAAMAAGHTTVKVKVGDPGDVDRVAAVRAAIGPRAPSGSTPTGRGTSTPPSPPSPAWPPTTWRWSSSRSPPWRTWPPSAAA